MLKKLMTLLVGTEQADRIDELELQVDELERTVARLRASLEIQRKLIQALRDVNADLDRRLVEAQQ
jgi:outer membrane murein-binding lipoprotein Lpp